MAAVHAARLPKFQALQCCLPSSLSSDTTAPEPARGVSLDGHIMQEQGSGRRHKHLNQPQLLPLLRCCFFSFRVAPPETNPSKLYLEGYPYDQLATAIFGSVLFCRPCGPFKSKRATMVLCTNSQLARSQQSQMRSSRLPGLGVVIVST